MQFIFFVIWYMIAILPILIFQEADKLLTEFMKKRGLNWDLWHTLFLLLVVVYIILYVTGYGNV